MPIKPECLEDLKRKIEVMEHDRDETKNVMETDDTIPDDYKVVMQMALIGFDMVINYYQSILEMGEEYFESRTSNI